MPYFDILKWIMYFINFNMNIYSTYRQTHIKTEIYSNIYDYELWAYNPLKPTVGFFAHFCLYLQTLSRVTTCFSQLCQILLFSEEVGLSEMPSMHVSSTIHLLGQSVWKTVSFMPSEIVWFSDTDLSTDFQHSANVCIWMMESISVPGI